MRVVGRSEARGRGMPGGMAAGGKEGRGGAAATKSVGRRTRGAEEASSILPAKKRQAFVNSQTGRPCASKQPKAEEAKENAGPQAAKKASQVMRKKARTSGPSRAAFANRNGPPMARQPSQQPWKASRVATQREEHRKPLPGKPCHQSGKVGNQSGVLVNNQSDNCGGSQSGKVGKQSSTSTGSDSGKVGNQSLKLVGHQSIAAPAAAAGRRGAPLGKGIQSLNEGVGNAPRPQVTRSELPRDAPLPRRSPRLNAGAWLGPAQPAQKGHHDHDPPDRRRSLSRAQKMGPKREAPECQIPAPKAEKGDPFQEAPNAVREASENGRRSQQREEKGNADKDMPVANRRRSLRLNPDAWRNPWCPGAHPRHSPVHKAPHQPAKSGPGFSTSGLMASRADQATGSTRRASLSGLKRPSTVRDIVTPATEISKVSNVSMGSPLPDIDGGDGGDPLQCSAYARAIFEHYMAVEGAVRAGPGYMKAVQTEINGKMRAVLVDWIVEVHLKFKLMPETLYLCVNLIDRYLTRVQVARKRLQLVGISALLIAAKYEEIWPPEVRDFVQICDNAYTRTEVLDMEKHMLIELNWSLTVPTAYHFLSRFLKAAGSQGNKHATLVAAYITELSLLSYGALKYKYSELAAAAVYLARRAAGEDDAYPHALCRHSTYSLGDLGPCVAELAGLMERAGKDLTRAVHRKYSSSKFHCVATETKIPQL